MSHPGCLPGCALAGSWSQEPEPAVKWRHSNRGCGLLNGRPQCQAHMEHCELKQGEEVAEGGGGVEVTQLLPAISPLKQVTTFFDLPVRQLQEPLGGRCLPYAWRRVVSLLPKTWGPWEESEQAGLAWFSRLYHDNIPFLPNRISPFFLPPATNTQVCFFRSPFP